MTRIGAGGSPATVPARCLADPDAEREQLASVLAGAGPRAREAILTLADAGHQDPAGCAVIAWARSGLMHLTGYPADAPLAPSAPLLSRARLIAAAVGALTAGKVQLDVRSQLACRAAARGWQRAGRVSANGSCRLLRSADGWIAVNLPRPADLASVPAVIGRELRGDAWQELAGHAAARPAAEVAAAAQVAGIPAAVLRSVLDAAPGTAPGTAPGARHGAGQPAPVRFSRIGRPGSAPPLVLDLSAMWAGPLCASILHQAGWRVLKVEDPRRPDGARSGPAAFWASLHAGIPAVRLDLASTAGRTELGRLAARAGVVLESSRPRALRQLGLVAEDWLAAGPGRIWVSVTGYGRDDPAQRAAFGDDAAVAGGLVAQAADATPVFCGDAIGDPLTGMMAGLSALAASADGGGFLVDAAMAGVCASLARPAAGPEIEHPVVRDAAGWVVRHGRHRAAVRGW